MKIRGLNSVRFWLAVLLVPLMLACEEVIVLDLSDAEPRTVIEGVLNASSGEIRVDAFRSRGFYEDDLFARLAGAEVTLTDPSGKQYRLTEDSAGLYRMSGIAAQPGERFRLTVKSAGGDQYAAETVVPQDIHLDSVKVIRAFGDPRPTAPPVFMITPVWKDPAGRSDYYRFKVWQNGEGRNDGFRILDGGTFDGLVNTTPLFWFYFSLGDTVRMEFQTIDSVSFRYFTQINDMARPSFVSATPYNPSGNFDNGALGYFGILFSEFHDLLIRQGR